MNQRGLLSDRGAAPVGGAEWREIVSDIKATLETLVGIIDDPDFDATDQEQVRDLIQYISVQVRAVVQQERREDIRFKSIELGIEDGTYFRPGM